MRKTVSLESACEAQFTRGVRERGESYFAEGRVELVREGDEDLALVRAEVRGSRVYRALVTWFAVEDGRIATFCDCPHYKRGAWCKHLWATFLAIDDTGWITSSLDVRRLTIESIEDDEDESEPSTDGHPQGDRHQRVPEWQRQLRSIQAGPTPRDSGLLAAPAVPDTGEREAWFVVDVPGSLGAGGLVVEVRQRERRRDGRYGKIKAISGYAPPPLTDPQDRELAELVTNKSWLSSADFVALGYDPYGPHAVGGRTRSGMIMPALYPIVLPRLAATERFICPPSPGKAHEDDAPLAWDDGDPWTFRIAVDADEHAQLWELSGWLIRENERVGLGQPRLVLPSGVVVFQDRIARLDAKRDFAWIRSLRKTDRLVVPYTGRAELVSALYAQQEPPDTEPRDPLGVEKPAIAPVGRLSISTQPPRLRGGSTTLVGRVSFLYNETEFFFGDTEISRFEEQSDRLLARDMKHEMELVQQVLDAGAVPLGYDRYGMDGKRDVRIPTKRFTDLVSSLIEANWVVEANGARIRRPGTTNLHVVSKVDWFEIDGKVAYDDVTADLPELLRAVRERTPYVQLGDGSVGMLPEKWLQSLGSLTAIADSNSETLRFRPSQGLLLDALLSAQENVTLDGGFERLRARLRRFTGITPREEPRGFTGKLRDYQKEGHGWLHFLREFGLGGCLADDMGLGKTVQALALLQSRKTRRLKKYEERRPSLIVVPKSLVFNWLDEAARFAPKLKTLDYTGTDRKARLASADPVDLIVTTYGTLRRDITTLKDRSFDYVILDEAQAIKNPQSQAAKASRLLRADHRLAMTGTPVENDLGELWSVFEFLNPGMLGSSTAYLAWTRQQEEASIEVLARSLRPLMLRRTKEAVLGELPDKTEQTLYCKMKPKQRRLYTELRAHYRDILGKRVEEQGLAKSKIQVLEALLRLRQAACHPGLIDPTYSGDPSAKLEALTNQLDEVLAGGHKALVFSQFTGLLGIVRRTLDRRGITYEYLDGRTRNRSERVARFQEDPNCPLFLISLKAGGQGLNLTAADYVFILDPWWNPAVEAQAVDRAHRMGQARHVFAYRLICKDTVEEKVLELQKTKRELADAILSADNSLIRGMTPHDLELLLG